MIGSKPHKSTLTLNVNGLNAPFRRQVVFKKRKNKTHSFVCFLQQTHLTCNDTHRLKINGWKIIYHANGKQKRLWVPIFISDKADFKPIVFKKKKTVQIDKDRYYIIIKSSIQQQDLTILNINTPNIEVRRFIRQVLIDPRKKLSHTVIVGNFNTPLTVN